MKKHFIASACSPLRLTGSPSPRRFCVALAVAERVKAFRLAFACVLRFGVNVL